MTTSSEQDLLTQRARRLGLHGVCARMAELSQQPWLRTLLETEEAERQRRSLERRVCSATIGAYRSMADFDWGWCTKIDRAQIEDLSTYAFLEAGENVLILGPNGVGKTMLAQNLAYGAVLRGHTVRFLCASTLLSDLAEQETSWARNRRLKRYVRPSLLVIDEVGYLSYDHRHADLLFEVVTRRYERRVSTIITTNKPFSQWNEVFPNAACVVTLIDRLTHRSELVQIEAESYRLKEAKLRAVEKAKRRRGASTRTRSSVDPTPA